jgi:signal transduction histidine kinase
MRFGKLSELLETTAFRLATLYTALIGVLTAGLFALIYWMNTSFVQAQTEQRLQSESATLLARYDEGGIGALIEAVSIRSAVAGLINHHYLLIDWKGEYVAGNLLQWPEEVNAGARQVRFRQAVQLPSASAIDWEEDEYYDVAARVSELDNSYRLLIGVGLYESAELREQSLGGLMAGSAITVVLALLAGTILGSSMVSRVRGIDSALAEIMAGNLGRRISLGSQHDEFGRLATRINLMLDRIEQLVTSLRQVTSNVSHDLRTPLHRLRGRLEQLLVSADDPRLQTRVQSGIDDIDEILAMFNDLLDIAEAEAGAQIASFEDVDMTQLTDNVAELYAAAAEDKDLGFSCRAEPGLMTPGKGSLLSQALGNLLENAIKFTPAGGHVDVCLERSRDGFDLVVADSGPGIAPCHHERVLQPFERLDEARSTPGSGLGLSVVSAIAKLHEARLMLEDNQPGLRVRLRFLRDPNRRRLH